MNREDAQLVLDHLDIIKHFAEGGLLEFHSTTWDGKPMSPSPVTKGIIVKCLPHYRKVDKYIQKPDPQYCSRWCPLKKGSKNDEVVSDSENARAS